MLEDSSAQEVSPEPEEDEPESQAKNATDVISGKNAGRKIFVI